MLTVANLVLSCAASVAADAGCCHCQVGIELKFKDAGYKHMVAVSHVPELSKVGRDTVSGYV